MITIHKFNSEDSVIWDAFVDASKNGTFMLKRGYMNYHDDRFEDYSLLFYSDDELVAMLPASIHESELRSHGGLTYGGIIIKYTMKQQVMLDCFTALKIYMQEHGIGRLIYKPMPYIYHKYPTQEDLYALWLNGARIIRRDVSTVIEFVETQIKLPKGRKAQIVRAKREGFKVVESCDFEMFIELENRVLAKYHQTKAVHTARELELLHARFPDSIHLYVANHDGNMEAGVLVYEYDNMVHTQYMASSDFARANGGLDLIVVTIIEKYKGRKKYLDFGISTEKAGMFLNNGLISQKESFGGRSVVYDFYELVL